MNFNDARKMSIELNDDGTFHVKVVMNGIVKENGFEKEWYKSYRNCELEIPRAKVNVEIVPLIERKNEELFKNKS